MSYIEAAIKSQAEDLDKCLAIARKLDPELAETAFLGCGNIVYIRISKPEYLPVVRHQLRESLGHWTDRISGVIPREDDCVSIFYDSTDPAIRAGIILACDRSEMPSGLLNDHCRFEKIASEREVFVCGT